MHFINILIESRGLFLHGLVLTVEVTAVSLAIAFFIGLFFAILRITKFSLFVLLAELYIWIIRGTPVVVQIFVIYYGLYKFVQLNAFWSGVFALAIHNGAYIAEIFRGAIQSVDKGQMEAASSLAMGKAIAMRRIILPQAFRNAIAPLGNQFIIGLKDSSLISFIGMQELFGVATTQGSNNFDFLPYYLVVSIYYLFIVLLFTVIVNVLEFRFDRYK